jgi:chromate transport protein ChrA
VILLGVGAVVLVMVIILVCRLLARAITDINKWDRRSGGKDGY